MTSWEELDHENFESHTITVRTDWSEADMLRVANYVGVEGSEWSIPGMPDAHVPVPDFSRGGGWELVDRRWSRSRFYPLALFKRPRVRDDPPVPTDTDS